MTTTSPSISDNALPVIETVPFMALTVSLRASMATLAVQGMAADRQVRAEAARLGLNTATPSQWLYTGLSGHPDDEFDLEVALPLHEPVTGTPGESFAIRNVPAFHCAQYTYVGPWCNLGDVYDTLFIQFYADDHVYDGRIRERYQLVDLENQERCITDIQIGIA
ncbi:GyrI-like domain-containing protein [Fibrella forsythiae]|uniref:GyrI-like domain-containing protein n=1 Tax=Fibrella forsythiae TaxID=2817061 RepID=A0ABS3JB05_9BACT|nr:GyrI-like domain-containing protein [Fibrella forsythiae]MBO0947170.1 GyrI-like domain-containing protein [Fibrella forsythiae]